MKKNHKNNDITDLQEWKKHKQASEKASGSSDTDQTLVDLETFLQETDQESSAEYGKDSENVLSGMLIW